MTPLMLKDIPNNLAALIANLHPGEVIQIVSDNQIVARLTGEREPLHANHPQHVSLEAQSERLRLSLMTMSIHTAIRRPNFETPRFVEEN